MDEKGALANKDAYLLITIFAHFDLFPIKLLSLQQIKN